MGVINSKELRKRIDEATSNSSLSKMRYVITEKPKWKVFKKKEVVPLPQYRPPSACQCGNDGPCKQKVTPNGVTIHYPQKKKKFGAFVPERRYKPPKVQKAYLNRFANSWKSISSALPFQTKIKMNMNLSLPSMSMGKVNHAFKSIKSMKPDFTMMYGKVSNAIKSKSLKAYKKKPERSLSAEFMFMPFAFNEPKNRK